MTSPMLKRLEIFSPSLQHRCFASRQNLSESILQRKPSDAGRLVKTLSGWGRGLDDDDDAAAQALVSQAHTLRLIRERTTIPVPTVFALDTTVDNEVGAPYMAMSYMPGSTVASLWFDGSIPAARREERRLRILSQVVESMAQLRTLRFDRIGSLVPGPGGTTLVGPCFEWVHADTVPAPDSVRRGYCSVISAAGGPFSTTEAYLEHNLTPTNYKSPHDLPTRLPDSYALAFPDFDSQNVLADDDGNVVGFIDWDLAKTMPCFVGYACCPGWITRDWDPLMYRAHYSAEMARILGQSGSDDWKYTAKSHIYESCGLPRWTGGDGC
ncbi:hypothetical protein B0T22DRAFT_509224 [Podospora appendiculata]|uniref:Aminoglycoside phosphotransferase domain-containing protein n=1 Tax=Podospora appendiculata TaxID=314037 RepID=A0AAE0XLX8_9PEZI|nr:hypothetical protein B0T22DRAFT_509224 [Podospora appendiculata]